MTKGTQCVTPAQWYRSHNENLHQQQRRLERVEQLGIRVSVVFAFVLLLRIACCAVDGKPHQLPLNGKSFLNGVRHRNVV